MLRRHKPLTFLLIFSLVFALLAPMALEAQPTANETADRAPIDPYYPNVLIPRYDSEDYKNYYLPWDDDTIDSEAKREEFYQRRAEIHPDFFRIGIRYWADIACYGEFSSDHDGYVKKWGTDEIRIFVDGDPTDRDMKVIKRHLKQLNSVPHLPELVLTNDADDADTVMMFDSYDNLLDNYDFFEENSNGMFNISWSGDPEPFSIYKGDILIATDIEQRIRDHVIVEELTQHLGLMDDSYEFRTSIFQQAVSPSPAPNELDWLVIEMHHRPEIEPGMETDEAMQILADLYLDYVEEWPETVLANRDNVAPEVIEEALELWEQIAFFGPDDIVSKWVDPMLLTFANDYEDRDEAYLLNLLEELRPLLSGVDIVVQKEEDFFTNVYFDFGPIDEIIERRPWVDEDYWYGYYYGTENYPYFNHMRYGENVIVTDRMTPEEREYSILTLFMVTLGLYNRIDDEAMADSVFSADWTNVTELSARDRLIIELHYRPEIKPGMSRDEAVKILRELYELD